MSVPQLPIAHELPEEHVAKALARDYEDGWEERAEEWHARVDAQCSEFTAHGTHRWETDDTPTFMCSESDPWIGHAEHCTGRARFTDRFGTHDEPCGMRRFPDIGCIVCGRYSEFLCDAPRCDVPMCDAHRHAAGRGLDFCPRHIA